LRRRKNRSAARRREKKEGSKRGEILQSAPEDKQQLEANGKKALDLRPKEMRKVKEMTVTL